MSLQKLFKEKYPELSKKFSLRADSDSLTIEIPFHNRRYYAWIAQQNNGSFIVGINFLHSHYDLQTAEENTADAFEHLGEIFNDQIVAIGLKNKREDYLIATMSLEMGLAKYLGLPEYEIVSFSKNY